MELGTFEFTVLSAVQALGREAYAPPILEEIEGRTGRSVARGALYTTLARLEGKALLESRMGEPTPVRGGKRKRFYRLTPEAVRALGAARTELLESWRGLGRALGELP